MQNKVIDSAKFLPSLLSNLAKNFAEESYKIKCKDCDCFPEYESVKDNLIKYKCLSCSEDYSNKLDEELKERFKNAFKFHNDDINEFILILRKGFYRYEYIGEWEKFTETSLQENEYFYSHLNMEDIADADYKYAKRLHVLILSHTQFRVNLQLHSCLNVKELLA